jgi:hypothetical protein
VRAHNLSSGKVEENHCRIRATEGEVYICSGRKELGLEGANRCYIWDGDWVITHVPRDKPYGRQYTGSPTAICCPRAKVFMLSDNLADET